MELLETRGPIYGTFAVAIGDNMKQKGMMILAQATHPLDADFDLTRAAVVRFSSV